MKILNVSQKYNKCPLLFQNQWSKIVLTPKITKSFNHPNQIKHLIQVHKLLSTKITKIFKAYLLQNDQYLTNSSQ